MTGLTAEKIRIAKRYLEQQNVEEQALCDKVVAVLGDDNFYPCAKQIGHPGPCVPDYAAT